MRPRLVVAALIALGLLVPTRSARAGERPGGDGGAFVDPDGDPTAVAEDGDVGGGGGGSGGGSGGGANDSCEWHVVVEDDFEFNIYSVDTLETQHSATGRWLERWCDGGPVAIGGYFLIPEGGPADPYQLALDAVASVGIAPPAIRTSPSESGRLYVQVPIWLWLERSWWQPYEATANAGRVWSSVRATPVATTWNLGDGSSVSCRGPGTPWQPGVTEDASTCTHTYRTSSASRPGGMFGMEATVTFEVAWTSNATGGGTLPAITRTSSIEVEVGEIQAIGTQGGQ